MTQIPEEDEGPPWGFLIGVILVPMLLIVALTVALLMLPEPVSP